MRRFDNIAKPQFVEREFKILVGSATLRGRIDAIFASPLPGAPENAKTCIIDFKSSDSVTDQDTATKRAESSLQLRLYALAFENLTGQAPDAVGLYYPESDLFGWANITPRKLTNSRQKILAVAADIEQGRFDPTPSPYTCGICPFNTFCPFSEA